MRAVAHNLQRKLIALHPSPLPNHHSIIVMFNISRIGKNTAAFSLLIALTGGLALADIGTQDSATRVVVKPAPNTEDPMGTVAQFWKDAWGIDFIMESSSMTLSGNADNWSVIAGEADYETGRGNYQEALRLQVLSRSVDVDQYPELLSLNQYISAGDFVGMTGYKTPAYGMVIESTVIDPNTGAPLYVQAFTPFGVSSTLTEAVEAASGYYSLATGVDSSIALVGKKTKCQQACCDAYALETAACLASSLGCIAACGAGAVAGLVACAATTLGYPICAGAVLVAQALCEAACLLNQKACMDTAKAKLITCLAACPRGKGAALEVNGLSLAF